MASFSLECETQTAVELHASIDSIAACEIVDAILTLESATGNWTVTVVFTSDEHLRRLHHQFLADDSVTDIITFPFDESVNSSHAGGDIIISVDRASAQAPEFGVSLLEELRFLVAHGVLHLLGWDDQVDSARHAMLSKQHDLLAAIAPTLPG